MDGFKELDKKLKDMTDPNVQRRRIAATRCPIHHKGPTDIKKTTEGWTYLVCCDRLGELTAKATFGL